MTATSNMTAMRSQLTDLANAVRTKTGYASAMTLSEMVSKIGSLATIPEVPSYIPSEAVNP